MHKFHRRGFLAGAFGLSVLGGTACGSSTDSATNSATSSAVPADGNDEPPSLENLTAEVKDKFQQFAFQDVQTGLSLPYNLFVPADYDPAKSYPLVLFIADSSLVGQDVTAPLSQYGALIWAGPEDQAKHESLVLVPEYPEVIIDDHGSYTTTDYVEMTTRLLDSVTGNYSVDPHRVYGTGQSMGCMTIMYLAARHPEVFAAELFVSGQWDINQLGNLASEKFCYIAAGGDSNASAGQTSVENMLTAAGVPFRTATWDATWPASQLATAATQLFAAGDRINFATFTPGTVLEVSGSSSPMNSEHMASFEPAYKITRLRDWIFQQTA
ncbi:alpha/beta hydrolase-fold protein [Nocardia wallacei]|uniref:carboxylesterase family protein n=1 Tax=Nocardia wallacei TaxID=480035 RepID=UPI0024557840|nr:alpha/beta hydrolase-fold protein [Nocardia wallacei]